MEDTKKIEEVHNMIVTTYKELVSLHEDRIAELEETIYALDEENNDLQHQIDALKEREP